MRDRNIFFQKLKGAVRSIFDSEFFLLKSCLLGTKGVLDRKKVKNKLYVFRYCLPLAMKRRSPLNSSKLQKQSAVLRLRAVMTSSTLPVSSSVCFFSIIFLLSHTERDKNVFKQRITRVRWPVMSWDESQPASLKFLAMIKKREAFILAIIWMSLPLKADTHVELRALEQEQESL